MASFKRTCSSKSFLNVGLPRLLIKWFLIKTVYDDSFYAIESFVLLATLYNGNSSSEAGPF